MLTSRHHLPRIATAALALLLSTGPAAAQSGPCFSNLIPNGGFGTLVQPWFATGATLSFPAANVDGINTSPCLEITPNGCCSGYTVRQPLTFDLTEGVSYEFSMDFWAGSRRVQLSTFVVPEAGGAATRVDRASLEPGFSHRGARFAVPTTGRYSVELRFGSGLDIKRIDNVSIRRNDLVVTIDEARAAGQQHTLRLSGTPSSLILATVGAQLSPVGVPLTGWQGLYWISPPFVVLPAGTLDANGQWTASLLFRPSTAGVPLHWQGAMVPPPGSGLPTLGCPVMIGMPSP